MEEFDLNLDNYKFNDILKLFHLSINFNEHDLKNAKTFMYKAHPDKSNLDPKFFVFFSKAYKKLELIYKFISQQNKKQSTSYNIQSDKMTNLQSQLMNDPNFNETFNQMFEEVHVKDSQETTGYGDWLKSEENVYENTKDLEQMKQSIKNNQLQTLQNVEETSIHSGGSYYDYSQPSFQSDPFSKLKYDDLKKAHSETVVPVTQEDYQNVKKYKNVNELEKVRSNVNKPLSLQQSEQYLKEQSLTNTESACTVAYELIETQEKIKEKEKKWWAKFNQIKNV